MSIAQTNTVKFPEIAQEGNLVTHLSSVVKPKVAGVALKPGRAVVPGGDFPDREVVYPTALAAAPQGLVATSATLGTSAGTSYGPFGPFALAQSVTLTLASEANWDATDAVIVGYSASGDRLVETVALPDAGNVTVESLNVFSSIESITIEAQTGDAGGSIGLGATAGALDGGITLLSVTRDNFFLDGGGSRVRDYLTGEEVAVIEKGQVHIACENAHAANGQVYVRLVATGEEEIGTFRSDADGGDAVPMKGWQFVTSSASGGIVMIERF